MKDLEVSCCLGQSPPLADIYHHHHQAKLSEDLSNSRAIDNLLREVVQGLQVRIYVSILTPISLLCSHNVSHDNPADIANATTLDCRTYVYRPIHHTRATGRPNGLRRTRSTDS